MTTPDLFIKTSMQPTLSISAVGLDTRRSLQGSTVRHLAQPFHHSQERLRVLTAY
jgi:hypothetical protein